MNSTRTNEITIFQAVNLLKGVWRHLLSKWWLIITVAIICGLLGVLYAWVQKPLYVATLTFVAEDESASKLGMYAGIAAQFGLDIGGGSNSAFEGDNLIELLKSRTLVEKTLLSPANEKKSKLLVDVYLEKNKINKYWYKDAKLKNVKFIEDATVEDRVRDSILFVLYLDIVKGKLIIGRREKKLNLIEIKMSDNDEYFAKRFVELLVANAIAYYTDYKIKKSKQNVEILQRQTDSVRGTLFGNINQVAAINDLNVNPIRQSVRTGSQRKQVEVQVNGALYGELLKNLELSKLALRKETPLIQIIDKPKYPLEKKKLGRMLGGILFSFIGSFLLLTYLLIRYWYKQGQAKVLLQRV